MRYINGFAVACCLAVFPSASWGTRPVKLPQESDPQEKPAARTEKTDNDARRAQLQQLVELQREFQRQRAAKDFQKAEDIREEIDELAERLRQTASVKAAKSIQDAQRRAAQIREQHELLIEQQKALAEEQKAQVEAQQRRVAQEQQQAERKRAEEQRNQAEREKLRAEELNKRADDLRKSLFEEAQRAKRAVGNGGNARSERLRRSAPQHLGANRRFRTRQSDAESRIALLHQASKLLEQAGASAQAQQVNLLAEELQQNSSRAAGSAFADMQSQLRELTKRIEQIEQQLKRGGKRRRKSQQEKTDRSD